MQKVLNSSQVGCYYDNVTAELRLIFHSDNDNFAVLQPPGMTFIPVNRAQYEALPPALNLTGVPIHHHLNQLVLPQMQIVNPALALVLQSSINATAAQVAVI